MAAKNEATAEVAAPTKNSFNFNSLNTLAVVSLATALTGFGAVAGIVTGHFALAQLKQNAKSGRGLAIAGLAIGYATVGLWIIGGIAMVALRVRYGIQGGGPMMGGFNGPDDNRGGQPGGMMGWGN